MSGECDRAHSVTTAEPTVSASSAVRRRQNVPNKRRSQSGSRRRPSTPEPRSKNDDDVATTPPVKAPRSKSKQRSLSSTGEDRSRFSAYDNEEIESISRTEEGFIVTQGVTSLVEPEKKEDAELCPAEEHRDKVEKRGETRGALKTRKDELEESKVFGGKESKVKREELDGDKTFDKEHTEESQFNENRITRGRREPSVESKNEESLPIDSVKKTEEGIQERSKNDSNLDEMNVDVIKGAIKKIEEVIPKTLEKPSEVWWTFLSDIWREWRLFKRIHQHQTLQVRLDWNKCTVHLLMLMIYCGAGGLLFRFTEGAFESFYKCGVKRVKRDFIDTLWLGSHNLREDDWKSQARRKLMEFEDQLHTAHEAGLHSYSGQRSWTFLNAVVYCITVVTTIGYGDISPSTNTGRAVTIIYAIFGIPMFLILLADFGKLFTRGIKFLWAFVRRLYYTGSCRKVRRTGPVQEVMKGVQLVYDFAINRRPSQMVDGEGIGPSLDASIPGTPALSAFEIDDEFNLPISVAIVVLLIYIFVGAIMFSILEKWKFFDSFYFVFISMSTIGFGDFVPKHPISMLGSIVYLVFGLALTSMCINVVQEKLSASFQQASAKIGATIGLRMAQEEEAAMVADQPLEIELPPVHQPSPTTKKSQSLATVEAVTVEQPEAQLTSTKMKNSKST